jgi:uncharacterized protein (TIGR00661 family)
MKYLFIIQGEGRGHLMQALALKELLTKNGHTVVEMLVGKSPNRQIPSFFIKKAGCPISTFDSPNFLPAGKENKVPLLKSVIYNTRRTPEFWRSILFLYDEVTTLQPDVVVNFYDFIAGMMFEIKRPPVKFICIAHQYLFLHPGFQFQNMLLDTELPSLLFFTRLTCLKADKILALSFGTHPLYADGGITVVPPLLRQEVLDKESTHGNNILGYMLNTSYRNQVLNWHEKHPEYLLDFFWDEKDAEEETWVDDTLVLHRLNDTKFIHYMAKCRAYATTGGFESVCEAMYLQKPVLMVPAHVEQRCNVMDASRAGAGVSDSQFNLDKLMGFISHYQPNPDFRRWVKSAKDIFLKQLTE